MWNKNSRVGSRSAIGGAVDLDAVALLHIEGGAVQHASIDGDAPLGDPNLGVAARAGAGARHDLGDALALEGAGGRIVRRGLYRRATTRRLVAAVLTAGGSFWLFVGHGP